MSDPRTSFPRLVAAALLLHVLGGAGQAAQAPPQARARWADSAPIRVWVSPDRLPAGGRELVIRALKTWSEAAAGLVELRPTTVEADAAVRVRFMDARARYGETAPRVDRNGRITSADIAIAATIEGDSIDRSIVVYLTALHELGHALGLPHTDRFDDIMYAFRLPGDGERYFGRFRRLVGTADDIGSPRATGLSPADVRALRSLYGR